MYTHKQNEIGKWKHKYVDFGKFAIGGIGFEMAFSMIGTYLMFFLYRHIWSQCADCFWTIVDY